VVKIILVRTWLFFLLLAGFAYAQLPDSMPGLGVIGQAPGLPQSSGSQVYSQQMTSQQQAAAARNLSPAQQKAVQTELGKSGGTLTPEAVEALKRRPEFQGLSADDVLKGKEQLEKKEAERRPVGRPGERWSLSEKKDKSIFDRLRAINAYQDISTDLRPFGYDFFQDAAVGVLTERKDIPVPNEYIVGPGDEVKILLWGRVNAQHSLVVDRNGNITIPQIGPVQVAGMSFERMSQQLIQQANQIVGANIDITMGSLKSIPIFVLGDVKRPGAYTVGSFATITEALLTAGGPSGIGTMRNIQLKRKDKVITTFDLYDLFLKGDKSKDLILQAGDVVFVPVAGPIVGIAGNVKRPAIYELRDKFDLGILFALAGGIMPTAYTQQIQIERIIKAERQTVLDINDKDLTRAQHIMLQDADMVKIFNIVDRETNVVFLYGNVKRPGKYEYKNGMRIKDLLKDQSELLPETYFDYALIKRLEPPSSAPNLIPFDLKQLFSKDEKAYNMELRPQDTLYVFSRWFFRDRPYVVVEGEVRGIILNELDELRFGELRKQGLLDMSEKRIDDLTRTSMTNLDEMKLSELRRRGLIEINEIKLDEARKVLSETKPDKAKKVDALNGDDRRLEEIRRLGGTTDETRRMAADLDQMKLSELRRMGLVEVSDRKLDELKRSGTTNLEEMRLADLKRQGLVSLLGLDESRLYAIKRSLEIPFKANMTIKDAILAAGGLTRDAYTDEAELYRIDEGTKKVTLRKFSLGKALDGNIANDIKLKDFDRIVVHSVWGYAYKKTVSIDGEVFRPGTYQYAENMTVKDLIFSAGNVLDSAYLEDADVSLQVVEDGKVAKLEYRTINLTKALEGDPAHDLVLQPYSRVFVKRITDWRREQFINLVGEVNFPGRYIFRKGETLSSLLDRAGGYTDKAYLRAAVFTRIKVRDLQRQALSETVARLEKEMMAESTSRASTALSPEEVAGIRAQQEGTRALIESLKKTEPTGRVIVRLAHLRLLKGSEFDVELEDGDSLYLPTKNNVVSVTGAIMSQGTYVFSEALTYKDYIERAGSFSRYADAKNIFVLKADGSAMRVPGGFINWSSYNSRWHVGAFGEEPKTIEPGDTIVVPEKIQTVAWLRTIRDVTQILSQVGIFAASMNFILK
jgi:polysaccharide biosynthesis/export protein